MSPDPNSPSGTGAGGAPPPDGGPEGSPGRANGPGGRTSSDVPGLRVANLLRMQQKLLTGGGPAGSTRHLPPPQLGVDPDGSGPVPDREAQAPGAFGIQDYIDVIARRRVYLLLPLVLVPSLAWIYTRFQAEEYDAVSRLLLTRSLVGQGVADDIFSGGAYVSTTALAQVAKLERVRKAAAGFVVSWVEGDDSGPLGRLWRGREMALPAWQTERALSAGDREAPAVSIEEQAGALASPGLPGARWAREVLTAEEREFLGSPDAVFAYISGAVEIIPDTQNVAVVLQASDPSPIVAAAAADALTTAMVEEFARLRASRSSVAIIERHLARNQENLKSVSEKIAALRHQAAASNEAVEGFPLELERQYELLKDHEFNVRSLAYMIEESERKVELLRERATSADEEVPPPEQLIQRLIDLELKRDECAARYTDKHPSMRKVQDEIDRTRNAIEKYSERRRKLRVGRRRSQGYYDPSVQLAIEEARGVGLKARHERLAETIGSVRAEIEKSSAQARSLEYELQQTSRKVLQDTAVALRTRLHRAQLVEGVDAGPSGGVVEAVAAEVEVIGQRRFQTVVLGVVVGLLAGVALALLADRLDETVRLPAEVRAISGLPTLQVIPHFKKTLVIRPEETVSGIANVFAVLRNHIRYSASGSPEKCILITSATSGEGKSLLAVNLAISFAQEGNRTCLVDADVQKGERHGLEEAVKLAWDPRVGLTGYLDGTAEFDQIVVPSLELSNLLYVSSGGRAANPPRALRSELAAGLFERLQSECDVVIVDAPPVLPVVDAAIVAGYCRAVIQVVRHGYTRRGELEESVRRLRHVGAPLVGLILNCVPGGANGYYARRYYSRYARYAG